jgi:EpsI family protein
VPALEPANGWMPGPRPVSFRPNYQGARGIFEQTFEKNGRTVGVFVAYYARERHGNELIMSTNSLRPIGEQSWVVTSEGPARSNATATAAIETRLRSHASELLVWHWYWAGDRWVLRPELVKALQALSRLLGDGDDAAVLVLYTPADSDGEAAREALREFHADMSPALRVALRQARETSRQAAASATTRFP